ncbi:F0F1 ATP synthase subunit I [mine drainage metagenome]|uniref:F0F1 ATP synthase subunit I n=1 Tax=mine drainage metagenome TaxID=410659 RepID=A0A1J5PAC9_9ZZZZ
MRGKWGRVHTRVPAAHLLVFSDLYSILNHPVQSIDPWQDEPEAPAAPALSRAEAQDLLLRKPQISVWRVVGLQVAVGLIVALVSWLVAGGKMSVALSALYGAAIIVVPSALFAGGIQVWLSRLQPGIAVYGFAFGELLKIALTVGLLLLAPRVVQPLNWPAMLVALVLTLQVYWIALILRGKNRRGAAS